MIRFRCNPWFSLGVHVDHRAPYVAVHLPGVCIEVGRLPRASYSRTLTPDVWLVSLSKLPRDRVDACKAEFER